MDVHTDAYVKGAKVYRLSPHLSRFRLHVTSPDQFPDGILLNDDMGDLRRPVRAAVEHSVISATLLRIVRPTFPGRDKISRNPLRGR